MDSECVHRLTKRKGKIRRLRACMYMHQCVRAHACLCVCVCVCSRVRAGKCEGEDEGGLEGV